MPFYPVDTVDIGGDYCMDSIIAGIKEKPYFKTDLGVLYNADCLDIMKQMPDKCVDLVLTDPPYGIGKDGQRQVICRNSKHNRKAYEFLGWDKRRPSKEYFDEIIRISINMGGQLFRRLSKTSYGMARLG